MTVAVALVGMILIIPFIWLITGALYKFANVLPTERINTRGQSRADQVCIYRHYWLHGDRGGTGRSPDNQAHG